MDFDGLKALLDEIRALVDSPNTNVLWSHYDNVEDVMADLDTFKQRLEQKDDKVFSELRLLFAPTGSFQEISVSSGWAEEFIELATRFDDIIDRVLD